MWELLWFLLGFVTAFVVIVYFGSKWNKERVESNYVTHGGMHEDVYRNALETSMTYHRQIMSIDTTQRPEMKQVVRVSQIAMQKIDDIVKKKK